MKLQAVRAAQRAAETATDLVHVIEQDRTAEALQLVAEVERHTRRVHELITEEAGS